MNGCKQLLNLKLLIYFLIVPFLLIGQGAISTSLSKLECGSITANTSGGYGSYDYIWDGPGINSENIDLETIIPIYPGNYCVTVSDLICQDIERCIDLSCADIISESCSSVTVVSFSAPQYCNGETCDGQIDIEIDPMLGLDISYRWILNGNLISTEEDLTNACAGNYTLEIRTAGGCILSDEFFLCCCNIIADPSGIQVPENFECEPPIMTGTVTNATGSNTMDGSIDLTINDIINSDLISMEWLDVDGIIIGTEEDISGLNPGYYCVEVSTGCAPRELCFTVENEACSNGEVLEIVEVYNHNVSECGSGIVRIEVLNGNGPFEFEWIGAENTDGMSNYGIYSLPGAYSVNITDVHGCITVYTFEIGFSPVMFDLEVDDDSIEAVWSCENCNIVFSQLEGTWISFPEGADIQDNIVINPIGGEYCYEFVLISNDGDDCHYQETICVYICPSTILTLEDFSIAPSYECSTTWMTVTLNETAEEIFDGEWVPSGSDPSNSDVQITTSSETIRYYYSFLSENGTECPGEIAIQLSDYKCDPVEEVIPYCESDGFGVINLTGLGDNCLVTWLHNSSNGNSLEYTSPGEYCYEITLPSGDCSYQNCVTAEFLDISATVRSDCYLGDLYQGNITINITPEGSYSYSWSVEGENNVTINANELSTYGGPTTGIGDPVYGSNVTITDLTTGCEYVRNYSFVCCEDDHGNEPYDIILALDQITPGDNCLGGNDNSLGEIIVAVLGNYTDGLNLVWQNSNGSIVGQGPVLCGVEGGQSYTLHAHDQCNSVSETYYLPTCSEYIAENQPYIGNNDICIYYGSAPEDVIILEEGWIYFDVPNLEDVEFFSVNGVPFYTFYPNQGGNVIISLPEGTYEALIQYENGCCYTRMITIENEFESIDITTTLDNPNDIGCTIRASCSGNLEPVDLPIHFELLDASHPLYDPLICQARAYCEYNNFYEESSNIYPGTTICYEVIHEDPITGQCRANCACFFEDLEMVSDSWQDWVDCSTIQEPPSWWDIIGSGGGGSQELPCFDDERVTSIKVGAALSSPCEFQITCLETGEKQDFTFEIGTGGCEYIYDEQFSFCQQVCDCIIPDNIIIANMNTITCPQFDFCWKGEEIVTTEANCFAAEPVIEPRIEEDIMFSIQPNPILDEAQLISHLLVTADIFIHSFSGNLISKFENVTLSNESSLKLNLGDFDSGLYLITVKYASELETLKLVKL